MYIIHNINLYYFKYYYNIILLKRQKCLKKV